MNGSVKSAARVLDILELLFRSEEPMALKDLVSIFSALPKSSAHALLRTLQSRGYVERDAADRYALTESLRQSSGWIGGPEAHLAAVARPVMEQLRDDLEELVFLGVRAARGDVKVIAKSVSRAPIRYDSDDPGPRTAYCTGMGRICWHSGTGNRPMPYSMRTRLRAYTPRTVTDIGKLRAILRQGGGRRLRRARRGICAGRLGDGGAGIRRRWYGRCCAERGDSLGTLSGGQAAHHRRRRPRGRRHQPASGLPARGIGLTREGIPQ